jgi:SAM-dependent methyltransferase
MSISESNPYRYADIFEQRGVDHDRAFRLYPQACEDECRAILALAAPQPGETLLDVPSAGGFLTTHLGVRGVRVIAVDPSPVLQALCARQVSESHLAPLDLLPLENGAIDVAVCLAGLHHEPGLPAVFAELGRVVRPGGRLAIAEASEGSDVANFLNGFVDRHNSMGHQGVFWNAGCRSLLETAGWRVVHDAAARYHWRFDDRAAMAHCLTLMFGIDLATPDQIVDAVAAQLGVDVLPNGQLGVRWSLQHVLAVRD